MIFTTNPNTKPDLLGQFLGTNMETRVKSELPTMYRGLFTGHDPARGSGLEVKKNSRVEPGRVRRYSKYHGWVGSGRVGSGGF